MVPPRNWRRRRPPKIFLKPASKPVDARAGSKALMAIFLQTGVQGVLWQQRLFRGYERRNSAVIAFYDDDSLYSSVYVLVDVVKAPL